jgi:rhodanese-related sulfurtransferase
MSLFKNLKTMFTPAPRAEPGDCAARVRSGDALLVDVREPGEWASGVAEKATLLPLSDLTGARAQWQQFLARAKDCEVLLYCASGMRSGRAAQMLVAEGFRATNTGGLGDWAASGWPVVKPKR